MRAAGSVIAQPLTKQGANVLARKFVAVNGCTALPRNKMKGKLDAESLQWADGHGLALAHRFKTLNGKAEVWSVAFDFGGAGASSSNCRDVAIDRGGSNVKLQHVNGIVLLLRGLWMLNFSLRWAALGVRCASS